MLVTAGESADLPLGISVDADRENLDAARLELVGRRPRVATVPVSVRDEYDDGVDVSLGLMACRGVDEVASLLECIFHVGGPAVAVNHVVLKPWHKLALLLEFIHCVDVDVVQVCLDDFPKSYHRATRGVWRETELIQHTFYEDFFALEAIVTHTARNVQQVDQVRLTVVVFILKVA